jgi:hypothetical protein
LFIRYARLNLRIDLSSLTRCSLLYDQSPVISDGFTCALIATVIGVRYSRAVRRVWKTNSLPWTLNRSAVPKRDRHGLFTAYFPTVGSFPSIAGFASSLALVFAAALAPFVHQRRGTRLPDSLSAMDFEWSTWRHFPDPREGEVLIAPFGPGCYELRHGEQPVLFGRGRHVAARMTSLLPQPLGAGRRNNSNKRAYVLANIRDIEYRTAAVRTHEDAVELERSLMRNGAAYLFDT